MLNHCICISIVHYTTCEYIMEIYDIYIYICIQYIYIIYIQICAQNAATAHRVYIMYNIYDICICTIHIYNVYI